MSPEVVYRSSHPDVLAHWRKQPELYDEWRRKIDGLLTAFGFAADSAVALRGSKVIGFVYPQDAPLPAGWRRDREMPSAIVAARRTAAGRRIGDQLEAVPQPDPRDGLPGGMPSVAFAATGMALMHPGIALIGGCVVVTWSGELEAPKADRIDPAVWERVPLSQYWAMREAAEGGAA